MSTNGHIPELAISAQRVGVNYDLRSGMHHTVRSRLRGLLGRGEPTARNFWALREVTFSVPTGEILGIVGRNGSGKSTLLLAIAGLLDADEGVMEAEGTATLLSLGAGFEAMLSGRQNIYLNAALFGVPRARVDELIDEIVEFSELGDFIDVQVAKYSTGMRARLSISIVAFLEPDILLIDEVIGVGDEGFRQRSQERIRAMMSNARAIVLVSHNIPFIAEMATKVLWLEGGRAVGFGEPKEVLPQYLDSFPGKQQALRTLSELVVEPASSPER